MLHSPVHPPLTPHPHPHPSRHPPIYPLSCSHLRARQAPALPPGGRITRAVRGRFAGGRVCGPPRCPHCSCCICGVCYLSEPYASLGEHHSVERVGEGTTLSCTQTSFSPTFLPLKSTKYITCSCCIHWQLVAESKHIRTSYGRCVSQ